MNILSEEFWINNYNIKSIHNLKRLLNFYKSCNYDHSIFNYTERHHMVPLSIIPGDIDLPDEINLITLSAREHFIVHLILSRIFKENTSEYYKMNTAVFMMCQSYELQDRYIVSSRLYEKLRIKFGKSIAYSNHNRKRNSNNIKGDKNPAYGKHWYNNGLINKFLSDEDYELNYKNLGFIRGMLRSKEHNKKIGNSLRGKHKSEEHIRHMSDSLKGRHLSDETRSKLSKSLKGRSISKETRKKLSEAMKGNSYGKGNKSTKNKVGINNGLRYTLVSKNNLQSYLDNGWKLGRLKDKKESK